MSNESSINTVTPPATPVFVPALPPLENGDHLHSHEFHRRYTAMPHIKKAELVEGIVYMASPVRVSVHGIQHAAAITWLGLFRAYTPNTELADNATLRLDEDNEPQPDAALFIDERCGGRSFITDDGYLSGAPELLVEIAASTASYDLREKREMYQNSGVAEYLVWSVYDRRIDWFTLENGQYAPLLPDAGGILCSRVFPGLWLNAGALLQNDLAHVISDLQQGLATPEHTAFVQHMTAAAN